MGTRNPAAEEGSALLFLPELTFPIMTASLFQALRPPSGIPVQKPSDLHECETFPSFSSANLGNSKYCLFKSLPTRRAPRSAAVLLFGALHQAHRSRKNAPLAFRHAPAQPVNP